MASLGEHRAKVDACERPQSRAVACTRQVVLLSRVVRFFPVRRSSLPCFHLTCQSPLPQLGLRDTGFCQWVGRGAQDMCRMWAERQGAQRPWRPDRARDEGLGAALSRVLFAADLRRPRLSREQERSALYGEEVRRVGYCYLSKLSCSTRVCARTHTHTHMLQYEVMQKSGKVSEKGQQLTWSLKVLPNIHSAPLNPTLPSVIWARTHPTLGILRLSLLPPSCPQGPPPAEAQAPLVSLSYTGHDRWDTPEFLK